jgi:hypothetical protein
LRLLLERGCSILSARMPSANVNTFSRELGSKSIFLAFAISLMVHFLVIGAVELGHGAGLWKTSLLHSSRLVQVVEEEALRRGERDRQPTPEAELVFMDVDPAQAVPEPPKDALYYSSQNTRAANPDPKIDLEIPKIDGKQERIPKTTDTMRPDPMAMQPSPAEEKSSPSEEPAKPEPKLPERPPEPEEMPAPKPEGETVIARAVPKTEPASPPEPVRPRPRTIVDALAQKGIIEGPKMRQKGGVRIAGVEGMDVKATPFGAYDAAFIAAVQARWFNLLDEREFVGSQAGKVVVEFNLTRDGRITLLRVAETEVSETLSWMCQRAILDPAPYRPFPPDLRRMLQRDFRPVRFTFYYNQ